MTARIIGPPVTVVVGNPAKARLSVAVELDCKICVPVLIPPDVFPCIGMEVNVEMYDDFDSLYDYHIVKEG